MGFLILLTVVVAIVVIAKRSSRASETAKLDAIIDERVKGGASEQEILAELVNDATAHFGRVLGSQELDAIRNAVINKTQLLPPAQSAPASKPIVPAEREADLTRWLEDLASGRVGIKFTFGKSPIILKEGEEAKFIIPGAVLQEPRAIRTSTGSYGGPTVRIARGLSWHVGSFRSSSQSHDEIKTVDTGTMVVTEKRLVFCGTKRTVQIDLRNILSLDPFSDGLVLHKEGREKAQYFLWPDGLCIARIDTNDRTYVEPLNGLIVKTAIEGLISSR